jgi:hypothetical protein
MKDYFVSIPISLVCYWRVTNHRRPGTMYTIHTSRNNHNNPTNERASPHGSLARYASQSMMHRTPRRRLLVDVGGSRSVAIGCTTDDVLGREMTRALHSSPDLARACISVSSTNFQRHDHCISYRMKIMFILKTLCLSTQCSCLSATRFIRL